eukprot:g5477.t1
MVASLWFGSRYANSFSAYVKEWRLFADVMNDVGQTLDMLSPWVAGSSSSDHSVGSPMLTAGGGGAKGKASTLWIPVGLQISTPSSLMAPPGVDAGRAAARSTDVDGRPLSTSFSLLWFDTEISLYLLLLAWSAICRAVCGVAAGASKLCTTVHFAGGRGGGKTVKNGPRSSGGGEDESPNKESPCGKTDPGDLATKEGSQETAVTFVGLILGMLFAKMVEDAPAATETTSSTSTATAPPPPSSSTFTFVATWCLFLTFTIAHVICNYRAVRSLNLRFLNRTRAYLLTEAWVRREALSVPRINRRETLAAWWRVNMASDRPRLAESSLVEFRGGSGCHASLVKAHRSSCTAAGTSRTATARFWTACGPAGRWRWAACARNLAFLPEGMDEVDPPPAEGPPSRGASTSSSGSTTTRDWILLQAYFTVCRATILRSAAAENGDGMKEDEEFRAFRESLVENGWQLDDLKLQEGAWRVVSQPTEEMEEFQY